MTTQHTPGPWIYSWETEARDWAVVTDTSGGIVANVNTETGPDAHSAPATRQMPAEANVRLIASAPALLEALEDYLAAVEEERDRRRKHHAQMHAAFDKMRQCEEAARAAIASARGTAS